MSISVTDPGISKPGRGRILAVWGLFCTPSHIPYGFVVRIESKINIVNTVHDCMLT